MISQIISYRFWHVKHFYKKVGTRRTAAPALYIPAKTGYNTFIWSNTFFEVILCRLK